VLIRTHQPVRATAEITAWALEHELELAQFSVTQPTLEDVYLELTGEHVADERAQIEALRR
jgi:hypothetical protein